jgi:hypothetical protein
MRAVLRLTLAIIIVLVTVIGMLWLLQRKIIYVPDAEAPGPPPAGIQEVALTTGDGLRLGAWLAAPTGSDRRVAVLVTPGNAGHRGYRVDLARALAGHGLTVLLLDYRGYGGNDGGPTEDGLRLDARAAYAYLVDKAGFGPDRIVYFGESLGAAVATELATAHPPAGLLLRSPFVDLAAAGGHLYPFLPVRLLLWDRYDLAEQLATVKVPTTVVYGTADRTIPPEQSREVAGRAGGALTLVAVEGADHNDPRLLDGPQVIDAVLELAPR